MLARETKISPTAVGFTTLVQDSNPVEARLERISGQIDHAKSIIGCQTYSVHLTNLNGEPRSGSQNWTIETRRGAHDVADLLVIAKNATNQLLVAVTDTLRPTVLLGLAPDCENDGFSSQAILPGQSGAYVEIEPGQSTASLKDTALEVLDKKYGLTPSGPIQILGASFFPNPRDSAEFVTQLVTEVPLPEKLAYDLPGTGLAAGRRVHFRPLEDVIAAYYSGEIKDTRLVQSCLALADRLEIKLPTPKIEIEKLPKLDDCSLRMYDSPQAAIAFCEESPQFNGEQIRLKLEKIETAHSSYFDVVDAVATIRNRENPTAEPTTVKFNSLLQRDLRSSNCLCYTSTEDGRVFVLVNKGFRPALSLRNSTTHPIGTELPHWSIEGVSFASKHTFAPDDAETIREKLKSLGIAAEQVTQISETEYPSPGFNPNCLSRSLVYCSAINTGLIDPQGKALDLTDQYALIELNSLISAANLGAIHDLNLVTSARLLQFSLDYDRNRVKLWSETERQQFSEIATRGSLLLDLIASSTEGLRLYSILSRDPACRKLVKLIEEHGVVPRTFSHREEDIFFDAGLDVFSLPKNSSSAGFIIQLLHDLRHYAIGSMIPFHTDKNRKILHDISGKPRLQSESEYDQAYRENEAEAGFFSHYDLPRLLGLADSEIVLGFQPLSKVFDALDITDREAALKVFRTIELERRIPAEVLEHEAYQRPEIRNALLQLLKLARVFDCHMQQLYPHWCDFPKVAQVALDFSETIVTTLDDHLAAFSSSIEKTLAAPEGFNPFKSEVGRFINQEIRMRAMRLAYVAELLEKNLNSTDVQNPEQQEEIQTTVQNLELHLKALHSDYLIFTQARENCTSLDYTPENLSTLRAMNAFNAQQAQFADRAYNQALDLLPSEQREKIIGRELPFFPRLEFGNQPEILEYALECERLSRAAIAKN